MSYDILIYPSAFETKYSLIEDESGLLVGSSGMLSLVSALVRVILTSRGSVPADPAEGTGIKQLVGGVYDRSTIAMEITREIFLLRDNIISDQARGGVPADERLGSLEVLSIDTDTPGLLTISILISNQSGESARTAVVVEE